MTVGKRLKEARKGLYTQEQVAGILGIDDTTISKYENDKSEADNETLAKFSSLYKVNLHWLLTGQGDKKLLPVQQVNERGAYYSLNEKNKTETDALLYELIEESTEEEKKFYYEMLKRMKK